jgi:hypothetical protein
VLFAGNERFGIKAEQFTELAQEFRGAVKADRGLQIRPIERFAQLAPKFPI